MVIREFGQEHPRHLLFFPGSAEPWIYFRPSVELLAARFHVMLLTPDGHDPEYPSKIGRASCRERV